MTRPTALALGWSLVILVACSVPGNEIPDAALLSFDKVGHVLLFLGFGWLWMRAVPDRLGVVVIAGAVYAIGTEVWQAMLPLNRSGDPYDAIADGVGLGLGVAFGAWANRRRAAASA